MNPVRFFALDPALGRHSGGPVVLLPTSPLCRGSGGAQQLAAAAAAIAGAGARPAAAAVAGGRVVICPPARLPQGLLGAPRAADAATLAPALSAGQALPLSAGGAVLAAATMGFFAVAGDRPLLPAKGQQPAPLPAELLPLARCPVALFSPDPAPQAPQNFCGLPVLPCPAGGSAQAARTMAVQWGLGLPAGLLFCCGPAGGDLDEEAKETAFCRAAAAAAAAARGYSE